MLNQPKVALKLGEKELTCTLMPVGSAFQIMELAKQAGENEGAAQNAALGLSLSEQDRKRFGLRSLARYKGNLFAYGEVVMNRLVASGTGYQEASIAAAVAYNYCCLQGVEMGLIKLEAASPDESADPLQEEAAFSEARQDSGTA